MQDAVDVRLRVLRLRTVGKISCAAALNDGHITIHDHVLCVSLREDSGAAGIVVGVGMTDEQNLDVAPVKAELLDGVAYLRRGCFQVGVDKDVTLRRGDEVRREVAAADVVEVVGDAEWRDGCVQSGLSSAPADKDRKLKVNTRMRARRRMDYA